MSESQVHGASQLRSLLSFEMLFALFLFAGVFNQAWVVSWIPVNITAAFVGLSGFGAAVAVVRGARPTRKGVALTVLFSIFILYALISLGWSPLHEYAYSKALRLVIATGWALAGPALIIASDSRRTVRFVYIIAGFGVFSAVSTILVEYGVISNPSANYLISGRVIGLGILVLVWLLFISEDILQRIGAIASLLISAVALVIGGGRTPFVATIVAGITLIGIFVLQWSRNKNTGRKVLVDGGRGKSPFRWIIASIIGVISIIFVGIIFVVGVVPRTIVRLMTVSTAPTSSLGRRFGYWSASIREFSTAPIFGHGLGSWPAVIPDAGVNYPHDIILEIGVELGMIGLILLLAVVGFGFVSALRMIRSGSRPLSWLIFALVGFLAINALISGDINDNRYLFAMVGLLITPAMRNPNLNFVIGH